MASKDDNMTRSRLIFIALASLVSIHVGHVTYASEVVEIQVNGNVSFQLPRDWVVLSDNKIVTLNSFLKSILPVSSATRFQANLKNDSGEPITVAQIITWRSDFSQADVIAMMNHDVDDYDLQMNEQMRSQIEQIGERITHWFGTRKHNISGLAVLTSEYSRTSKRSPLGHFRVQVVRVYSKEHSFSFVISYHEETLLPLRIVIDKIISTLRCPRCLNR